MILLQLFWTFFIIGLFNFGGGGAMIALIQTQVVDVRHWITESAFTDIVAISQSTPGPIGINCATFVGYEVAGYAGSAVATLSIVLPSFLIFLALVKIFTKFHENPYFVNMMRALKPAVAGLIAAAAVILIFKVQDGNVVLIRENFVDFRSWALFGTALALGLFTKVNPIWVIVGSALIGVIIF